MQAEQVCDAKQWDVNATKVAVGYTGLVAERVRNAHIMCDRANLTANRAHWLMCQRSERQGVQTHLHDTKEA